MKNLSRKFLQNRPYFLDCFSAEVTSKNRAQLADLSANLSQENPAKFDIFFCELSEALDNVQQDNLLEG